MSPYNLHFWWKNISLNEAIGCIKDLIAWHCGQRAALSQAFAKCTINHRKNLLCSLDFRHYLISTGCLYLSMYVCMWVIAIVATTFNLQLWNVGIIFIMWISKNCFSNFWKIDFSWVIAIVATLFNLQLWNFGIILLMWISKNCFSNFWKIDFSRVIALFNQRNNQLRDLDCVDITYFW